MNRRLPFLTFGVVAMAALTFASPTMNDAAVFDREQIFAGQFWRLFTCHWAHHSTTHLLWNIGVVMVAGGFFEQNSRRGWLLCFALSCVVIGPGLFVLESGLAVYAGLSGLASAFVMALVLWKLRVRAQPAWIWWTLVLLVLAKTAFDVFSSGPFFVSFEQSAIRNVPMAHALGMVAGWASHCFTDKAGSISRPRKCPDSKFTGCHRTQTRRWWSASGCSEPNI